MVRIHIRDAEHWITVHPNGNKEEKGTPLLIEGSNGHYVVKGGAGGKLNGKTVNPKSMSKARGGTENEGGEPSSGEKPAVGHGGSAPQSETPKAKPKVSYSEMASGHHAISVQGEQPVIMGAKFGREANILREHLSKSDDPKRDLAKYREDLKAHTEKVMNGEQSEHPIDVITRQKNGGTLAPKPAEAPKSVKKTEVGERTIETSFGKVSILEPKIGNSSGELRFRERQADAGVVAYAKEWIEENGDRFLTDAKLSAVTYASTVDQAKAALEEYQDFQLANYGDQRLPPDERAEAQLKYQQERKEREESTKRAELERRRESAAKVKAAIEAKNAAENERIEKQRKITKREDYTPAKTSKAAAAWAMKNNLADRVDYSGLSVEVSNGINESLSQTLKDFPHFRERMGFCGSGRAFMASANAYREDKERMRLADDGHDEKSIDSYLSRNFTRERVPANCFAFAAQKRYGDAGGVGFHDESSKQANTGRTNRILKQAVDSQWSPVGCGTPKAAMDHELGHMMDHFLNLRNDSEFGLIYERARKAEGGIKAVLCEYGSKNAAEFIAEAWSEYRNNPNPRPVAKSVGDLIRRRYAEKFR